MFCISCLLSLILYNVRLDEASGRPVGFLIRNMVS